MNNPQYSPNVSTYHSHHPSSQQPGVSTDASVIRMKDLEIQTLLREIESLRATYKSPKQKIPLSIDFLIRSLKLKTKSQEEEIRRLRDALNAVDPLNRQIYNKLKEVVDENKELEKMVSAGRVEQLGLEIATLRRETELCKTRIEGATRYEALQLTIEYKRVLFQMDEDLENVIAIVKAYQERYGELE